MNYITGSKEFGGIADPVEFTFTPDEVKVKTNVITRQDGLAYSLLVSGGRFCSIHRTLRSIEPSQQSF